MSMTYGACYGEWLAQKAGEGSYFTCDRCDESVHERDAIEDNEGKKQRIYCQSCHEIILEERRVEALSAEDADDP